MKVGVVSDTHGLLRPEVLPALAGVEHILHAGDVGGEALLDELRAIAPVTAVSRSARRTPGCRRSAASWHRHRTSPRSCRFSFGLYRERAETHPNLVNVPGETPERRRCRLIVLQRQHVGGG